MSEAISAYSKGMFNSIKTEEIMSLYEKYQQVMDDNDVDAYLALLHDDFNVVTFHKSGKSFSKDEWASMVTGMMANDKFIQESSRCVYENDDILVEHSFMSYPDNTERSRDADRHEKRREDCPYGNRCNVTGIA